MPPIKPRRDSSLIPHLNKTVIIKSGDDLIASNSPSILAETRKLYDAKFSTDGLASKLQISVPGITPPNLIVEARAGSGKTTVLIEGLKKLKGLPVSITPSPQQAAIWDAMYLSKDAHTICMCAFNSSIADELKRRVPAGVEAKTMNSLGFYAVTRAIPELKGKDLDFNRNQNITATLLHSDRNTLRRTNSAMSIVLQAVDQLVNLCKMNLVDGDEDSLWQLVDTYAIDLGDFRQQVFELVPEILELSKDPSQGEGIHFSDQLWLPIVLNLPVFKNDLLLVDEAQDLNRCQQALAKKAGKRIIMCGDSSQAIYAFCGADSNSLNRMKIELDGCICNPPCSSRIDYKCGKQCQVLPLTVTRRCGKAIVKEANRYVPDFEAHESNPEGIIRTSTYASKENKPTYHSDVRDSDMVLCRNNGPLVSQCFKFLKLGRKAFIQGRKDVAAGLIAFVNRIASDITGKFADLDRFKERTSEISEFLFLITEWLKIEVEKEKAKKDPKESKLQALQDRYDCLVCFCESHEIKTANDIVRKIESIFTDNPNAVGIKLSSIHKSKGLEADRVFLIMPMGAECPKIFPKMQDWQKQQECNLKYVAITRAKEELIYVY